ncbi:hypothetical protein MferCBS31731_007466 [Microsporum ferrugineum]
MPPNLRNVPGQDIRMSFADVFKSSKVLKAERDMVARKREQLRAENKRLADLHAAMAQLTTNKGQQPKANSTPPAPPPAPPPPIVLPPGVVPPSVVPRNNEARSWTDQDNEQLMKLKQDSTSWRAIAVAMKWPVHELKERWRAIKPEPPEEPKPEKVEVKAESPENKKKVAFTESTKEKKTSKESSKKVMCYTDESLSMEEAILLNKLADKYDKEMWLRISSKFFDKTGKRLDPEEARRHIRPS